MAYAYVRLHMPLVRVLYLITTMNPKFLKFLRVALTCQCAQENQCERESAALDLHDDQSSERCYT